MLFLKEEKGMISFYKYEKMVLNFCKALELDCIHAGIALAMFLAFMQLCQANLYFCSWCRELCCTDKNIVLWIPVNKRNYTCHSRRLNGLFFLKIKTVEMHSWGENKGSRKGCVISKKRNDKS